MNPARRRTASAAATAVVLATTGGLLTALATPASAAVSCTSPVYQRQFFANTAFSGAPKKTDCDSAISESWGAGAPASGLPSNSFGVRWTLTRDFGSGGPFAFTASAQDGIRVYLDGTRRIDLWKNVSSTVSKTVNLTVPSGKHTLRVDYVNWTGNANAKFTYAPRTTASVDKVRPLAPAGTSASYDKATGKAKLTWSVNKEMDLAGYRVYRRPKDSSTWTRMASTTGTSYTDATLPVTGAAYFYEIRAYDKAGNESTGTADQLVTTVDRTAPSVPTGLSTDSGQDGLRVGWSAVPGAVSYRVYRATGADGTYTRVGSTGQVSYLDASAAEDTPFSYRVTALDAAGNESARSAAVSGTRQDLTPPSAVTGVTATPTEYGFEVSWDANPTPDLEWYVVHRGELMEYDEGQYVCYASGAGFHVPAGTTSYTYTALPDGEEACFMVDAVDDASNSSYEWTREMEVATATELDMTPTVATPEGSPVRLTAESAGGAVALSWSTVADATGYHVYRWNPDTKAYEKLAATAETSYKDIDAAKGTSHFYWVTAQYADGTESAPGADGAALAP
ncbi:fibronectin type III domain-containing protein [Streptomyces sp. NPDC006012]|uniref:fibronectin type III domain-containing protein n=1 Tax=Streptomyces sp. NPDC006012 TaxID=3364739 RepID=UPI00367F7203